MLMTGGGNLNYILVEDEKSGKSFYNEILSVLGVEERYIVKSSNGKDKYFKALTEIEKLVKEGDMLYLVFDNVCLDKCFSPTLIVNFAMQFCLRKRVNLRLSAYYCFEELFLSYKYLSKMVSESRKGYKCKKELVKLLDGVRDCILMNEDPFIKFGDRRNILNVNQRETSTREKFAKSLLHTAYRLIEGDFEVSDGSIGACWFSDCENVNMDNKKYRCPYCRYRAKKKTALEKLHHFEDNSISARNIKFSDAFT